MTDTSGLPSAIGIEAVEFLAAGSSGVTVRVTGRWRRRRPEWHGPAMLVVESEGRRHRIPAMPEPPSLSGTLPGTWRMSFSVPAEFANDLEGRTWLQLGAVMAPLSLPGSRPPDPTAELARPEPWAPDQPPRAEPRVPDQPLRGALRPPIDPEVLAAREAQNFEMAARSARRRAEEAEVRVDALRGEIAHLQAELEAARARPERLEEELRRRERAVLAARQIAHAEGAAREEMLVDLAERERTVEALRRRINDLTDRVSELEHELRRSQRQVDQAEQAAAAARAALARGGGAAAEPASPGRVSPGPAPPAPVPTEPASPEPALSAPAVPGATRAAFSGPALPGAPFRGVEVAVPAIRVAAELQAEVALLPAALAPRLAPAPEGLPGATADLLAAEAEMAESRHGLTGGQPVAAGATRTEELTARVRTLEAELALARAELGRELERGVAAQARVVALEADLGRQREHSTRALHAIADFRRELQELRVPAPAPPSEVEPERLSAALERLRDTHPAEAAWPESAEPPAPRHPSEVPPPPAPPEPPPTPEPPAPPEPPPTPEPPAPPEPPPAPPETPPPAVPQPPPPPTMPEPPPPGIPEPPPPPGIPEPPPPGIPEPPPPPALTSAAPAAPRLFRSLVREDPSAAGRLVLALLPAQRLARPRPVAYDLLLGPAATVQVTLGDGAPRIELHPGPRPLEQVQFQVEGDPAALARLLAAGPVRRRVGRRLARLRGERSALIALRALVTAPLSLSALVAAGVGPEPGLTFRLVAGALEARESIPETFTIGHRAAAEGPLTATLSVRAGAGATVSELALEPAVTTTVICPPGQLLSALLPGGAELTGPTPANRIATPGAWSPTAVPAITGDPRPLELLRRRLEGA